MDKSNIKSRPEVYQKPPRMQKQSGMDQGRISEEMQRNIQDTPNVHRESRPNNQQDHQQTLFTKRPTRSPTGVDHTRWAEPDKAKPNQKSTEEQRRSPDTMGAHAFNDRRQRWKIAEMAHRRKCREHMEQRKREQADKLFAERQWRLGAGVLANGTAGNGFGNGHRRRQSSERRPRDQRNHGMAHAQRQKRAMAQQQQAMSRLFNAIQAENIGLLTHMITKDRVPIDGKLMSEDSTCSFWTPLIYAARKGKALAVKRLLKLGANVNFGQPHGWSPIHHAAWNGHQNVLDVLLMCKGLNLNKLAQGWTVLHVATARGHLNCVQLLLLHPKKQVDAFAVSLAPGPSYNMTASELARIEGHQEIAMWIQRFLADLSRKQVPVSFDFLDFEQEALAKEEVYQPGSFINKFSNSPISHPRTFTHVPTEANTQLQPTRNPTQRPSSTTTHLPQYIEDPSVDA